MKTLILSKSQLASLSEADKKLYFRNRLPKAEVDKLSEKDRELYKKTRAEIIALEGAAFFGGSLLGGLAGTVIGRPSLATGAITLLAGVMFKQPLLTGIGGGMLTAGLAPGDSGVNGPEIDPVTGKAVKRSIKEKVRSGLQTAKGRTRMYSDMVIRKLYLDKVFKGKFGGNGVDGLEDAALRVLEDQTRMLEAQAIDFSQQNPRISSGYSTRDLDRIPTPEPFSVPRESNESATDLFNRM